MTDLSSQAWNIMIGSNNPVIDKVTGKGFTCEAHVKLASVDTLTKQHRVYRARKEGRDPHICGRKAMWRINKRCYCQNHAGQQAIDMLVMLTNGGTL